jgi:hypothetical protein
MTLGSPSLGAHSQGLGAYPRAIFGLSQSRCSERLGRGVGEIRSIAQFCSVGSACRKFNRGGFGRHLTRHCASRRATIRQPGASDRMKFMSVKSIIVSFVTQSKSGWAAVLAVLIGALLLLIPAAMNGFPFIFPDSGDYIVLHPLLYRSPYYGLFFRILSFNKYIWIPVIVQSIIVSYTIWELLRFIAKSTNPLTFLGVVLALLVGSSLPYFIGFILADIFTPILFITMYLLYFHYKEMSKVEVIAIFLTEGFAVSAHVTNLTLSIGLATLFALITLGRRQMGVVIRPLCLIAGPIALAATAILLFNGVIFRDWSIAPAGQSFMLANMIEGGPARDYLRKVCPVHPYKICVYRDKLPVTAEEILWSTGLFEHLGGFPAMKNEAQEIVVRTIATRPGAVARMIAVNFAHALVTHAPCAECRRGPQVPSFANLLDMKYGPNVRAAYENSAEMRDALPYGAIEALDGLVYPASMVALLVFAWRARNDLRTPAFTLSISVCGFILGDTLLCSAVSGVHDRYQSRVTWLAPLAVALLILRAITTSPPQELTALSGLWPRPATPIRRPAGESGDAFDTRKRSSVRKSQSNPVSASILAKRPSVR